jgi:adenylate cyclase class IV
MAHQTKANLIECELRGPITWNDFTAVQNDVERKWGPLIRTVELVLFAKGKNDFRIKIDNLGAKLVLKYRAKAGEARFEREVAIRHEDVPQLAEIMHRLGERRWVMSYVDKYEAHRGNSSVCFKFGSQIGDFFEIEEMVHGKNDIPAAIQKIRSTAEKLGLQLWDRNTFKKLSFQSWENVKPEPLIGPNGSLHPFILQALNQIGLMNIETSSETIAEVLKRKDNNLRH